MNKLTIFLMVALCFNVGATDERSLRSLIESISRFPPVHEDSVRSDLDALKEIPDAEMRIWEFVENAEVIAPFHVENGLSALERAGLVGRISKTRSREILEVNVGRRFDTFPVMIDSDPDVNSLGFGTPVGGDAQVLLREISLLSGAIGLLGRHGEEEDINLISKYADSRTHQVRDEATRAIETIKARGKSTNGKSGEKMQKASIESDRDSTAEPETLTSTGDSGGNTHLKWPWIVGAIAVLGILMLLIRAFLRGRASQSSR